MTAECKPMQYAGCYTLHLYCDSPTCLRNQGQTNPGEFAGSTFSAAVTEARFAGWQVHRKTRTATCPVCLREQRNGQIATADRAEIAGRK